MAEYVDGFIIAVPKKNMKKYMKDAKLGKKLWMKHGALSYREAVADDMNVGFGRTFPKMVGLKPGETVIFSWITFKSKAHRDRVNKAVMNDPRMAKKDVSIDTMPFKMNRLCYGGFKTVVK